VIYEARLKAAKALLQVAQTNLQEVESGSALLEIAAARAQLKNLAARLEFSQIDETNKRNAGVGTSRDDLDKARVQVKMDEAAHVAQKETLAKLEKALLERIDVARNQVEKAKGDLEEAQKNLKNCTIVAPVTGSVLSKKAELGGYVNPFAFNTAGSLCDMADLADLEVELDIQERDISRITVGCPCLVMPEAFSRDEEFLKKHPNGYEGVYERRMPIANRAKGAITVRVKLQVPPEERGVYLLPDMGAMVTFKKPAKAK